MVAPMLPFGAASCGGSSELIPQGADQNDTTGPEHPEGINGGSNHCQLAHCLLHGIDHSHSETFCHRYCYRCYDANILDPWDSRFVRGPSQTKTTPVMGAAAFPIPSVRHMPATWTWEKPSGGRRKAIRTDRLGTTRRPTCQIGIQLTKTRQPEAGLAWIEAHVIISAH